MKQIKLKLVGVDRDSINDICTRNRFTAYLGTIVKTFVELVNLEFRRRQKGALWMRVRRMRRGRSMMRMVIECGWPVAIVKRVIWRGKCMRKRRSVSVRLWNGTVRM
jgi:hypothetical protein